MTLARILPVTLAFEGGYSNDPDDPGGATMKGVTQAVYDRWRAARLQERADVRYITDAELEALYDALYWRKAGCDRVVWPLSGALFDFAVNSGPKRAVVELQRILGISDDGIFGRTTQNTAASRPSPELAKALTDARRLFLSELAHSRPAMAKFLPGWLKRCAQLERILGR